LKAFEDEFSNYDQLKSLLPEKKKNKPTNKQASEKIALSIISKVEHEFNWQ